MSKRLPPLNALRVFDSAARHLSFTKAAEELFVTQAAVSHQIKTLEEFLGLNYLEDAIVLCYLPKKGKVIILISKKFSLQLMKRQENYLHEARKGL